MNTAAALVLILGLAGADDSSRTADAASSTEVETVEQGLRFDVGPFLSPGAWWNMHFADGIDLGKRGNRTIHAFRVVQTYPTNPDWVRVAYPRSFEEHWGLARISSDAFKEGSTFEEVIEAYEGSVTDWKYEWVNLRYVVRMTSVREEYERRLAGG